MKLEVSGLVAQSEVVLGEFGFGRVKSHLITGQPALITQNRCGVDRGSGQIKIYITAHVHVFTLIARLQLGALLSEDTRQEQTDALFLFLLSKIKLILE